MVTVKKVFKKNVTKYACTKYCTCMRTTCIYTCTLYIVHTMYMCICTCKNSGFGILLIRHWPAPKKLAAYTMLHVLLDMYTFQFTYGPYYIVHIIVKLESLIYSLDLAKILKNLIF